MDGTYLLNGNKIPFSAIQKELSRQIRKMDNPENAKIGIAAEKGTPFNLVMRMMGVAKALKKDAILLTKPKNE